MTPSRSSASAGTPNRVKCALLGWTAFEDALKRAVVDGQLSPGGSTVSDDEETA